VLCCECEVTMEKESKRNLLIDVIKGFAILLMLFGHVIQFASGSEYQRSLLYYDNVLFKIIYSFHMPLFMVVSGWLFFNTLHKKTVLEIVTSRFRTLVLPIFSFSFIVWVFRVHPEYTVIEQIRNYLSITRYTLWFLWALFYSSMGVLLGNKLFKDNIFVWVLLIFGSFLTPDKWFSELYKFTFPCFLFGYYAHKHDFVSFLKKHLVAVIAIGGVVFVACLFHYNLDCFVYISGSCILKEDRIDWLQLYYDVFRLFVGILGSVFFVAVFLFANQMFGMKGGFAKAISKIGVCSMGIYCFQTYFFILYNKWFTFGIVPIDPIAVKEGGNMLINRLLCFVLAFSVSFGLTYLVRRLRPLNIMLLGGR